ncbi:T9SS type A sorting domain-containing protein [candidate division WOR-3 bacterium]|nr:T9SS type A sorting domain-containing protein [candidate division WOR-3 bacterium]
MKNPKKLFLSGIVLFLFSSNLFAQAPDTLWTRTYGGDSTDFGESIQQTTDGGYIAVGYTKSNSAGGYDVWLLKLDSNGDTLWTRRFGGIYDDYGGSVEQTNDGGYIIVGATESFGAGHADVWLLKTDVDGDTIWTKTYGDTSWDYGYSVQQTSDGGYIIAGSGGNDEDVYLIKTDSMGDTLWTKMYGDTNWDYGSSVRQISDGGYIVAGTTWLLGGGDVYLIKTDSNGDSVWSKHYGGSDLDEGYSVCKTSLESTEHYITAGVSENNYWHQVILTKTDEFGGTCWVQFYGQYYSDDGGYSVQEVSDGNYVVAGFSDSMGVGGVYLIKIKHNSDLLWETTYGPPFSVGRALQETSDAGYVIAGYKETAGNYDVYIIKTKPDVGIKEKQDQIHETTDLRLLCRPNPFTTITTITLTLPSIGHRAEGVELRIYDVSGRLIESIPLTTNQMSLGADLKPSIYFLKLNDKNVGKVVKVR